MPPAARHTGEAISPVAFDMTAQISGTTGVARYVAELGAALEAEGVGLRRWAVGRALRSPAPGTRWIRTPARLLAPCWRVARTPPLEWFLGSVGVVHATGALAPATRRPLVVTIHDVAAIRFPDLHPQRHVRQQRALVRALDRAAVVIAVSQSTADDLAALGVRSERLVVAPLGLTPLPLASESLAIELPRRYLLCVGETAPRKRLELPVRALARLHESDLGLVLVGPPAGDEARLRGLISELGLSERVVRAKHVDDQVLARLYQDAAALCFPSVAEGFGLPVLEALSVGLPVLSSDIPTSREVAGDAAIYLPADPTVWAEAFEAITSDKEQRRELGALGRRRAAAFTWQRTAGATIDAYRLALEDFSSR